MGCQGMNLFGWGLWWPRWQGFLSLVLLAILVYAVWVLFRRLRPTANQGHLCPACDAPVQAVYLRCPECHERLKRNCPSCGRIVDAHWTLCPYCEADLMAWQRRKGERDDW